VGLRKDIWRPAIIEAPFAEIVGLGAVGGARVHWLPFAGSSRFLADPFGLWRDGRLNVFVETYDYRDRRGVIEVLVYDAGLHLIERHPALSEPWHLSYPFAFDAEGETWMLPEAHRSRGLTLYRAVEFPRRWEPVQRIELDHVAVDATPVFHDGLWWLFYASADRAADKTSALYVAFAERLRGPWRPHLGNPVRRDLASTRPGGTPVVVDGRLVLPVQDCTRTYGGAIRPLMIEALSPDRFQAVAGAPIPPPTAFAPFDEGLHTLASAGAVTLVDAKRTELSLHGLSIEVARETRKLLAKLG
jgi:hypothetical protein